MRGHPAGGSAGAHGRLPGGSGFYGPVRAPPRLLSQREGHPWAPLIFAYGLPASLGVRVGVALLGTQDSSSGKTLCREDTEGTTQESAHGFSPELRVAGSLTRSPSAERQSWTIVTSVRQQQDRVPKRRVLQLQSLPPIPTSPRPSPVSRESPAPGCFRSPCKRDQADPRKAAQQVHRCFPTHKHTHLQGGEAPLQSAWAPACPGCPGNTHLSPPTQRGFKAAQVVLRDKIEVDCVPSRCNALSSSLRRKQVYGEKLLINR